MRVTIEKLAYGGDGVARPGGEETVVFVPRAAAGDVLDVDVTLTRPRFRRARITTVATPGKDRVKPACPHYAGKDDTHSCGGCHYMHLSYPAQLAAKVAQLREALQRIGGIAEPVIRDAVAAPAAVGYRNKGTFRWSRTANSFGMVSLDGSTLVAVEKCALLIEPADRVYRAANAIAKRFAASDPAFGAGVLALIVRGSSSTGDTLAALVTRTGFSADLAKRFAAALAVESNVTSVVSIAQPAVPAAEEAEDSPDEDGVLAAAPGPPRLFTDLRAELLHGVRTIREKLGKLEFVLDAEIFFQVNTPQAEKLFAKAIDYAQLPAGALVLDLYCGCGAIALSAASKAGRVIGADSARAAILRGDSAAKKNGIGNVRLVWQAAEDAVKKFVHAQGMRPDAIFLDPPRSGIKPALLRHLPKLGAPRVVYVSCNPATLARDVKGFAAAGYRLSEVTPFDLFPQTFHLEAVALLERVGNPK